MPPEQLILLPLDDSQLPERLPSLEMPEVVQCMANLMLQVTTEERPKAATTEDNHEVLR